MIRIATGALCTLLADLVPLAAPEDGGGALAGVLLHTDRGHPYPSEPGKTDLLIGTAASKFAAGQAFTESEGQMTPMLWPTNWVAAVIGVFKPMTKANKDHQVQITRAGDHVLVQEDPNLFDDGMRLEFKTGDLEHYPRSIWQLLTDKPRAVAKRPDKPRLDISPAVLAPFLKIAQRRGTTLNLFKYHQERLVLLEIGGRFRGYVVPSWYETDKTSVGQAAYEPDGEIFFPDLPLLDGEHESTLWTPWRDTGVKVVKTGTPDPVLPLDVPTTTTLDVTIDHDDKTVTFSNADTGATVTIDVPPDEFDQAEAEQGEEVIA